MPTTLVTGAAGFVGANLVEHLLEAEAHHRVSAHASESTADWPRRYPCSVMTDYGHELRFGSFLTPSAQQPEQVVALARACEAAGLDLVTFQDHPYHLRSSTPGPCCRTWPPPPTGSG
jgi:nucleoside-diphosphate-sugar epimerase